MTINSTLYALSMLILVLGLIMGFAWVMRTYGGRFGVLGQSKAKPTLKVTQRLLLSAQHTLIDVTDSATGTTTRLVIGPNHTTVLQNSSSLQKSKSTSKPAAPRKA